MTDAVRLIGAPADYGASRRGVDMGPSAIRYADLEPALDSLGLTCVDAGDLAVPPVEASTPAGGTRAGRDRTDARYLPEIESCAPASPTGWRRRSRRGRRR